MRHFTLTSYDKEGTILGMVDLFKSTWPSEKVLDAIIKGQRSYDDTNTYVLDEYKEVIV